MAEITRIGNYIVIDYDSRLLNFPVVATTFSYDSLSLAYDIRSIATQEVCRVLVSDIPSISDGVGFYTEASFLAFLRANTGLTSDIPSGSDPFIVENIVFVAQKTDFPTAIGGIITLASGKTYILTDDIDLTGDRIVCGGVVNLFGTSSETSFLTSTGLGVGVPLITSIYTLVLEKITFRDVDTCLSIDGNTNLVALDWRNVNFADIPNVGTINSCENFIYDTGAFLGAQGFHFDGTIGTVGLNNSLFTGIGSAGSIITIEPTCVITRRFRIIYSSIVAFGSTNGIDFDALATVPIEGFILDTINFSGGGTYLSGLDFSSESSLFINCKGITNTTAIANMYMKNNATATVVSVTGDRYAMLGTTQVNALNQKFSHVLANNSVKYDSTIPRLFRVLITLSFLSTVNNIIGFYIGVKRGALIDPTADRISESEIYVTANGTRPDTGAIQAIVELEQDDEVYLIVQNTTATNNITVQFMNMTIERTN